MINVVHACAIGNLILALTLVFSFGRLLSERLTLLTENASRLAGGKELENLLSGEDELAYLDKVINTTSQLLLAADEHRRSIFGMVAHDMRSPLMAAQNSIQLICEMDKDSLSSGTDKLNFCQDKLSSILSHVQSLLTLEKSRTESSTSSVLPLTDYLLANASCLRSPFFRILDWLKRPKLFHLLLLLVLVPAMVQTIIFVFSQLSNRENRRNRQTSAPQQQYLGRF